MLGTNFTRFQLFLNGNKNTQIVPKNVPAASRATSLRDQEKSLLVGNDIPYERFWVQCMTLRELTQTKVDDGRCSLAIDSECSQCD